MNSKNLLSVLMIALGLTLAGCGESQGPAEEAGEKIDESMETTSDKHKDVGGEKIDESMGAVSDKLKDAGEEMGDAMEEAGDKMEEATDN